MLRRAQELYRTGGIHEVGRGIKDFLIFKADAGPLILSVHPNATLTVGNLDVEFNIEQKEDISRASGHGELDVLTDFADELATDDVVWDVGANIGTYAIIAELSGATAEAFEPGTEARARLNRNSALNGVSVNVHEYALADRNGKSVLSHEDRSGIRRLTDDDTGDLIPVKRGDDIDVPQPDVVKIDVEGAELDVLDGMLESLTETRICYVEYHPGVDRSEVVSTLERAGLSLVFEFDRSILKFTRKTAENSPKSLS